RTDAEVAGSGRRERAFGEVPVPEAARYCCAGSEMVLRLREAFQPELDDHRLLPLLETIELPLVRVLANMEWHGVLIDLGRLGEISRQLAAELVELERALHRDAGPEIKISSTHQQRTILFE